ncbi:pectinesterase family protein [Olivibacter sp. SDN3]|uniref:pectinesterase family protein n=1 Tax=Olivibacter sp. SDN3 TaxID=2764720 RepID=UPI001C9E63FB|nr:pectinesterase family protein [Olivibacter sp. SDN3]
MRAVAVNVTDNRVAFRNCRFLGFQDTLYAKGSQDNSENQSLQYYENCYIEGSVDFIFGAATALFVDCQLHSIGAGYITAASTPQDKACGFCFYRLSINRRYSKRNSGSWKTLAALCKSRLY